MAPPCVYVAWETQRQPQSMDIDRGRPTVSAAEPAAAEQPAAEPAAAEPAAAETDHPEPEPEHLSDASSAALPLVLSRSVKERGWFGLQARAAAVCRGWREAALCEECCASLALLHHQAEARWLHAAFRHERCPWQKTARRIGRAEWWHGAGRSSPLSASAGQQPAGGSLPSILSLAQPWPRGGQRWREHCPRG